MPPVKPGPADLLTHPEVVGAIVNVLRAGGVTAQEMNDGVASVQTRVLSSLVLKPPFLWPRELGSWKGLGIKSAQSELKDRAKKAARRRKKGDAGLIVENADEHESDARDPGERDPLDQKRAIELLAKTAEQGPKPELDREVARAMALEEEQAITARRLGVSEEVVRNRVRVIKQRFNVAVTALGAAFVLLLVLRPSPNPGDGGWANPTQRIPGLPSVQQLADLIRDGAKVPCSLGQGRKCLELLDEAKALDEAGDRDPLIQQARVRAQQEVEDEKLFVGDGGAIPNVKGGGMLPPKGLGPAPSGSGSPSRKPRP